LAFLPVDVTFNSNPKIVVRLAKIGLELSIGKGVDDAAVLHDVVTVRDGGGEAEVLLDQQDRSILPMQRALI
jgi:hypothetical protein